MTAKTGRNVSKWTAFLVDESAGTLRTIAVDSTPGHGTTFTVRLPASRLVLAANDHQPRENLTGHKI